MNPNLHNNGPALHVTPVSLQPVAILLCWFQREQRWSILWWKKEKHEITNQILAT